MDPHMHTLPYISFLPLAGAHDDDKEHYLDSSGLPHFSVYVIHGESVTDAVPGHALFFIMRVGKSVDCIGYLSYLLLMIIDEGL